MSMKKVDLRNSEILSILHEYSDWFFSEGVNQINPRDIPQDRTQEEIDRIVSDEERDRVAEDPNHIGFPLDARAVSLNDITNDSPLGQRIKDFKHRFRRMLGARDSALHFYYPEDSFISWHTNENAAGKNLILSYSSDGRGFFRFMDPVTEEIVTIQDEKGWNAKMGNFGDTKDTRVWHCARNYGPRLTISYIIKNEAMWEDLKEELEEEN